MFDFFFPINCELLYLVNKMCFLRKISPDLTANRALFLPRRVGLINIDSQLIIPQYGGSSSSSWQTWLRREFRRCVCLLPESIK